MAYCGSPAFRKPKYSTFSTFGCPTRNSATRRALSVARVMRSCSVSRLRMSSQQVCGLRFEPKEDRMGRIFAMSADDPRQPPATRSLWPPTYFVSE